MFFMRALRPQYAYFLAHRQSNPVHPHGIETKAEFRPLLFPYHYYTRFSLKCKHFSGFFLTMNHLFDGSMMFFSRKETHNILSVSHPSQNIDCQNQHKQYDDIRIRRF